MKVRKITESDMPEIFGWFRDRKWPIPLIPGAAPAIGLIAEKNRTKIACAWCYLTGRSIAFIDWIGSNPGVSDALAAEGICRVITEMRSAHGENDPPISAFAFFTQNDKLAKKMEALGFKKETGYTRLLWTRKK